jgi:cytochrome c-type biogenesis protein CcmF
MIIGSTGLALALFAMRAPQLRSGALFAGVSREAGLTWNNLLLMAITAVVFLGTFYPVIMEAVSADKISVGPPYYNLVFVPLSVPLMLLVTVGPMLAWKRDSVGTLAPKLKWLALATLALFAGMVFWLGLSEAASAMGFALALWLVAGGAMVLARRWKGQGGGLNWRLVRTTPPAVLGMSLAHAGLGVLIAGISAMASFSQERTLVMRPGETVEAGPLAVRFLSLQEVRGPNYVALQARFEASRNGGAPETLVSERRLYENSRNQTTEAGIGVSPLGNSYVAIGESQQGPAGDGLVVRAYWHPLVGWIWFGGLMMAMGGAASLADRRYRIGAPSRAPSRPLAAPPVAGAVPAE